MACEHHTEILEIPPPSLSAALPNRFRARGRPAHSAQGPDPGATPLRPFGPLVASALFRMSIEPSLCSDRGMSKSSRSNMHTCELDHRSALIRLKLRGL